MTDESATSHAGGGGLIRVRLDVAYDGTDFVGWARQPDQRSVQQTLTETLSTVLRCEVALTVAGRTDSGVHATGQVVHLDVGGQVWSEHGNALVRRLNGVLPGDVRVLRAQRVLAEFDARFAALWRRYEYRISDHPAGVMPLRRRDILGHPRHLDVSTMRAAAALLVGEHDFAAYCRRREGATTVRGLQRFDWSRVDVDDDLGAGGGVILGTVQADAFCHSMVRSLVGAMIAVGEGRRPVEWPAGLLSARSRSSSVAVVPARGLTLVQVRYPDDAELAVRVHRTRRRRDESAENERNGTGPRGAGEGCF